MFPLSPPPPQKRLLHKDPPDQHTSYWLWLGWGGCCCLEETVFLWAVEPLICKLVPKTTFTEDGKATVAPSMQEVTLGESLGPPGEVRPDQSQRTGQCPKEVKLEGPG